MIKYFLLLLLPFLLLAESDQVSSIPLPTTYIQSIDVNEICDNACLQAYLDDGQIFTFLAIAGDKVECIGLDDERSIYVGLLNIGSTNFVNEELKIAMILPYKVIGRYAYSTSNAVFAYLLTRNHPFVLKNFQIADESPEEIARVLEEIKAEGFNSVIAPLTPRGAEAIVANEEDLNIYFPTINQNDLNSTSDNIYFGAIDYKAQIDKLIPRATSPLVILYDKSRKGKKLYAQTKESYLDNGLPFQRTSRKKVYRELKESYNSRKEPTKKRVIAYGIDRKTSNMKWHLENNQKIQFGTFFLNTPVIKSTMIISQFTTYDTNTTSIFSTQINYDPLIFSMTQKQDRADMLIANSININNNTLIEANSLLSNDIVYDWINYATTVGADLFYHKITHQERTYPLPVVDNQVLYPISIVKPSGSRFEVVEKGELPVLDENGILILPTQNKL